MTIRAILIGLMLFGLIQTSNADDRMGLRMGADVYLQSVYGPNNAKWQPIFDAAVAERDRRFPREATTDVNSSEFREAQGRVSEAYQAMWSEGYFRDSYNSYGLFQQLYLNGSMMSWWRDVIPMCEDGLLPIPQAHTLLGMVKNAKLDTTRAEETAREQNERMPDVGWSAFYEADRRRLIEMLEQSISLNEPLRMSL